MRILYAMGNFRSDVDLSKEPGYWIDRDIYPALVELGHEVLRFDWALPNYYKIPKWLEENSGKKNDELVEMTRKLHKEKPIDVLITAGDGRYTARKTVEAVKAMGIITLNHHPDDVHSFPLNEKVAPVYDWNWTIQPAALPNYKKVGARCIYTPGGANPHLYKPYDLEKKYDVTFIGRNIGYRDEYVQHIIDRGVDTHVWGVDWPHDVRSLVRRWAAAINRLGKRPLTKEIAISTWYIKHLDDVRKRFSPLIRFEDMIKMYSQSIVNLNFAGGMGPGTYDFDKAIRSVKLRDIEVAMSGGFYLTERTGDIEALYVVGKEIDCFSSKKELVEKCKHYVAHPDEARSIAKAGRERALRDYTWKTTLGKVFSQIGLA